jgi:hypothetical protein
LGFFFINFRLGYFSKGILVVENMGRKEKGERCCEKVVVLF